MSKPIFTGSSPNAEADDIWLAFKTLWKPWTWKKGSSIEEFSRQFKAFLPAEHLFLFESGRTCLYALLQALNLNQNDEVLLQAYTCVAVPEPVLWAGLKPIYVDIGEQTLTMSSQDLEKKITSKSKVLIIQHTFGQPAELDTLMEIARKHNLFVIEDCAHALGAKYKGKNVGTFGDASFFSFGRDKVISSVFGGVLVVKNDQLAEKVAQVSQNFSYPSLVWIWQQLIHPLVLGLGKATYNFGGKYFLELAKRLGIISKAVYPEERKGQKPRFIGKKMPNALVKLAVHQFQKLERFNSHRRKIAKLYANNYPLSLPYSESSVYLRYVFKTDDPSKLFLEAKKNKIYLGDWYRQSIAPSGVDYSKIFYDPSLCPNAEKMAQKTVNLPTDIHISIDDAKRIIEFIKKFYGSAH